MRKSSFGGGRPSISGAPLRVLNDNVPSKSRMSTAPDDRFSFGGRASFAASKLPVMNQHPRKSSISSSSSSLAKPFSYLPKTGRPSSGVGIRRADIAKDPRPISEKRYQTQCIKQLLEFLMANNYPHPISQKLLVSPTSKDFFKIFEFIYGKYCRGYQLVYRMDEEVPLVLRTLMYPFALSKTYLHSVGSPHSWQYLLAALKWMIDLHTMTASIADHGCVDNFIFEPEGDSFEEIPEKFIFGHYEKTFSAFMSGHDTSEKNDEELCHSLKLAYHEGQVEDMIAENVKVEQELGLFQQAEEKHKQMLEGIELSRHDGKVIQTYIVELQQYKKLQEGDLQKRKDEHLILVSDVQTETEKFARMQEVYEKQDLTPADVGRLKAELEGLKQQLDHLEKQIGDIETDNWNVTMEQAKLNEKVELEVAAYNRQAIALKLIPETAEFADGADYRITTGFNADIVGMCENQIKPKLLWMKKQCTVDLHHKSNEKFQLTCEVEQFQESINERKEHVAQMAENLVNAEAKIEYLKQMLQSGKRGDLIEKLKQDVIRLETLLKQSLSEQASVMEEYKNNSKLLRAKKEAASRELCEIEDTRKLARENIVQHMDSLKEKLMVVMSRMDKLNNDLDKKTALHEAESKQRDGWLRSLLKK